MFNTVNRFAKAAVLAGAASVALGLAPAHADTSIDNYISYLDEQGIGFHGSNARMIQAGLDICDSISSGHSPVSLAKGIYLESDDVSSMKTSITIVVASVMMLCPEYTHLLPGSSESSVA